MQDNHVGAVVVHDGKHVVGLVTDRDVGLQLVDLDLDPFETSLSQIMSSPAAVVPVSASESEAAALMLERRVRRLPIVDGDELAGMITLDDLILEQSVAPATLDPQVRRARAEQRHAGRAALSYGVMIGHALACARLESRERTEAALEEVLFQILRRITPDEAHQLLAQLPSLLQGRLAAAATGPDREVTRETLQQAVASRLDVAPLRASAIVRGICESLSATISAGELDNLRSQLPSDMKALLPTIPVAQRFTAVAASPSNNDCRKRTHHASLPAT
jgi:uncharacterized protein (DUF2267 family)